jgi:hypothetical protein
MAKIIIGATTSPLTPHEPQVVNQPFANLHDAATAALVYSQNGFDVIPVPPKSKVPSIDWQKFLCPPETVATAFAGNANIAIKNGQPSGNLVDLDLDSPEALALAPKFLPETACIFGHQSKQASHRIYRTDEPIETLQRPGVNGKGSKMLLEARSTNSLTVFPPSIHPSGEKIQFEAGKAGLPTLVAAGSLLHKTNLLATTALIAQVWPKVSGMRHNLALALSGGLLRYGVPVDVAKHIIVSAAAVVGDEEAVARGEAVISTLAKIKEGQKAVGWKRFAELLEEIGDPVVKKCTAWLAAAGYAPAPLEATTPAITLILQPASEVVPKPTNWLWPGWIAYGTVCLLDGDPGMGKSTISVDIAVRLSAGKALPDGTECAAANVLLCSGEDSIDSTIVNRLKLAGADLNRIKFVGGVQNKDGKKSFFSIPDHLELLRDRIIETNAKFVVIDPFMAYLGKGINANSDHDVRQALMPLAEIAAETGAAILVVRHLNKQGGRPAIYRGGGSIGILGAARTALIVGVNPFDETTRILAVSKSNIGLIPPAWRFKVVGKSYMEGDKKIEAAAIEWLGTTNISADQLVSETVEKASAINEAMEFLAEALKDGPRNASEVLKLAEEQGIAKTTVDRASKKLGVKKVQIHEGGKISGWIWSLPPQNPDPTGDKKNGQ